MKNICLCLSALFLCVPALAESKTEIVVKEGVIKTTTPQGDWLLRRGQKAVLKEGKVPAVSFNNKIVEKLLQLDRQIQTERSKATEQIDYTSAQVYSIDQENIWKVGGTLRMPNKTGKATNTCRIGTMSILQDMTFYDFQGNPISYTIEKVKADGGYYHLQFPEAVQPDQEFTFLLITDFKQNIEDFKLLEKVDGQWISSGRNGTPYCLNYFHVILPNSAIFVKSEPVASVIEEQEGRVAVTMRDYTGKHGEGAFAVHFLWPEKDGTSLRGIPWTDAGPEAVEIYELFMREDIQSPALWGELAVKLVGGGFYDQAYDAFKRCYNGHDSALWDYTALTWQGHLHDLWQQRELAVENYQQALAIKPKANMRHDQWGIILTKKWLKDRLNAPFTEEMLSIPDWKSEFMERFKALAWKDAGPKALQLYEDLVQRDIDEVQGWVRLGIKLVGSGYYDQAMDCFIRGEKGGSTHSYLFCALIWQGHLLDLKQEREKAIEKYYQALEMEDDEIGQMRHDQWGIVLTKDWVRQRLEKPFTKEMLE